MKTMPIHYGPLHNRCRSAGMLSDGVSDDIDQVTCQECWEIASVTVEQQLLPDDGSFCPECGGCGWFDDGERWKNKCSKCEGTGRV